MSARSKPFTERSGAPAGAPDPILHRSLPGPVYAKLGDLQERTLAPDRLLPLASARVMFADYALLQRDFPRLGDAALARHPDIAPLRGAERTAAIRAYLDRWLLEQAALVSTEQASQERVNTPIPLAGGHRAAWRPPRYGRAALVRTTDGPGLLDIKGIGMAPGKTPQPEPYETGLLIARGALQEVVYQWMLDAIFERAAPELWTLPVYGVIDPGFLAFQPGANEFIPAAILVRRAHRRPPGGVELPRRRSAEELHKFEIEMLLRHYGLTSASSSSRLELVQRKGRTYVVHGGCPMTDLNRQQMEEVLRRFGPAPATYDGVNVQLTHREPTAGAAAELVDFGQFEYAERFDVGVVSLVYSSWLLWSAALRPKDPGFIQPDPQLLLPRQHWSNAALKTFLAELTWSFHRGEISGDQIHAALMHRVNHAVAHWNGE
jgi:hypothetical protein